jgi:hypothetical protein
MFKDFYKGVSLHIDRTRQSDCGDSAFEFALAHFRVVAALEQLLTHSTRLLVCFYLS